MFCVDKLNLLDWKKPTRLMIGDFQDWGSKDIERYNKLKSESKEQVVIGIRHTKGNQSNFNTFYDDIKNKIIKDIPDAYVIKVPNIIETSI